MYKGSLYQCIFYPDFSWIWQNTWPQYWHVAPGPAHSPGLSTWCQSQCTGSDPTHSPGASTLDWVPWHCLNASMPDQAMPCCLVLACWITGLKKNVGKGGRHQIHKVDELGRKWIWTLTFYLSDIFLHHKSEQKGSYSTLCKIPKISLRKTAKKLLSNLAVSLFTRIWDVKLQFISDRRNWKNIPHLLGIYSELEVRI